MLRASRGRDSCAFAHSLGESVLYGVLAACAVTCDRSGRPEELGSPRAVELFEDVDHHPSDAPDEVDSFTVRNPFPHRFSRKAPPVRLPPRSSDIPERWPRRWPSRSTATVKVPAGGAC